MNTNEKDDIGGRLFSKTSLFERSVKMSRTRGVSMQRTSEVPRVAGIKAFLSGSGRSRYAFAVKSEAILRNFLLLHERKTPKFAVKGLVRVQQPNSGLGVDRKFDRN